MSVPNISSTSKVSSIISQSGVTHCPSICICFGPVVFDFEMEDKWHNSKMVWLNASPIPTWVNMELNVLLLVHASDVQSKKTPRHLWESSSYFKRSTKMFDPREVFIRT